MLNQVTPGDPPFFVYPAQGWAMNAFQPPQTQSYPSWPLIAGVDGREPGTFKRFRGFRRLDYDIREYSGAGLLSTDFGEGFKWGTFNNPGVGAPTTLLPEKIIDFMPVRIDRPGLSPLVGFVIHAIDGSGDPVVILRARALGDSSIYALFHVELYYQGGYVDIRRSMQQVASQDPLEGIDRMGGVAIGRTLFLTHKYAGFGDLYKDYYVTHAFHAVGPDITDRAIGKTLAVRNAGCKGMSRTDFAANPTWFESPTQFTVIADSSEVSGLEDDAKFQVRIRFVNKTTGFVGPMSDPQAVSVGAAAANLKKRLHWADSGALTDGFIMAYSLGLAKQASGSAGVFTLDPWDNVVQVFRTFSVADTNPALGGAYYILDHEIPIVITPSGLTWAVTPFEHAADEGVPQLDDNALSGQQEYYDPEFDQPGELSGGPTLGELDGMLISLDAGATVSSTQDNDISRGDIRWSPPWKYQPSAWLEAIAYRSFHRVEPTWKRVPQFMKVGSIAFLASQNKFVYMQRNGTLIYTHDMPVLGGLSNREAVDVAGDAIIFMVTDADVVQIDTATAAQSPVLLAHEILSKRWKHYVRDGRMMTGYDPQLNAVFIAPRADVENGEYWMRHETLVIWLSTQRISFLYDCYHVAMKRGIHPITGKEHLFLIDPAGNITYPDDYAADDDGQVSSMVGISKFEHPDLAPAKATLTITINAIATDISLSQVIFRAGNEIPVALIENTHWFKGANAVAAATSLTTAINTIGVYPSLSSSPVATRVGAVITVTFPFFGPIGTYYGTQKVGVATDITISPSNGYFQNGETASAHTDVWGGVYCGKIFDLTGTTTLTITDTTCSENGRGTFDQYGFINASTGVVARFGALKGSQVYFFRLVTGPKDADNPNGEQVTYRVIVADGRIKDNTKDTFLIDAVELNFRTGFTGLQKQTLTVAGDEFAIAPVVTQIVGAPIDWEVHAGSAQLHPHRVQSIGVLLDGNEGTAASDHSPVTGDLAIQPFFAGLATPDDMKNRVQGAPLEPLLERSQVLSFASEAQLDNQIDLGGEHGLCIMPVLTHYGTGYNFECLGIYGKANVDIHGDPAQRLA